jgi:hypothetical protein
MVPYRLMALVFVAAALLYVGVSRMVFELPVSLEAAEACGFTSADFTPAGDLQYPLTQAWWISFGHKQEYWSAVSIALAVAFMAFALASARRVGGAVASGAAMGGGLLAFGAVCLSCLAPALSLVGVGVASGLMADVPKWLMALNTLLLTSWGTLFLSRRLSACPMTAAPGPDC